MTPRHAFPARFTDAPSIQPERVPAHRAGRHRADVPVDWCRALLGVDCYLCGEYVGTHRLEVAA